MLSKYSSLISKRVVNGYNVQRLPSKFDNIIVAMSGGVDSSVAAAIFSEYYPNVRGIYMQNWSQSQSLDDPNKEPCYEKDWKDACRVGEHLNIPVDFINFENDYWNNVFQPMLDMYANGLTPNPDINCNTFVKFGSLVEHLDNKYGKDNYWLVSGHYSRILNEINSDASHLLRSYDKGKDQSYYLSQVASNIFPRLLLPIGNLIKPEVRSLATSCGLENANKPDSQGICFVNNSQHGKFKNFLKHYLTADEGNIVTIDSKTNEKKIWGKHSGLWSYTIGQKVGISMPQGDPNYKGTWFVSEKNKTSNELVIVKNGDNEALYNKKLSIGPFKPLGIDTIALQALCKNALKDKTLVLQYRSLQTPIHIKECEFKDLDNNEVELTLELNTKQRAIVAGQYGCLYINERVLGSGTISKTW
ncbi:hypothetical protein TPHA_0A00900 [Tetrapisispora phaffii CBS 4417]|uniref:tRNA-5-taurinomethyluridine 2-sulfurtransferase n=1 Tax=Tetrapisispora phaffii (strain ATCC 24235 / CBS 4417 / NBRC 1672 / NRRL Y-8282 / UCD 70-5) TaxID=1071381 RepID=G8BMP7_TETPH|nr:hypothetical protein TPHA_0A00900 [Tetrapisispora phaffii CBS 4417]CCE61175.1 hypothetical protein TPHA_0A00900 [Tetrapisispora phaffii CBS 4417]